MILLEPTISATAITAESWTAGMPALSISFASVAPQRVLVPQVEVNMTPETPSAFRLSPILCPTFFMMSTILDKPVVL